MKKNLKKVIGKFILPMLLTTCVVGNMSAQNQKGLSRVNKVQGVEAYFMSEPLREYDVLFDVGTGLKATSVLTAGLVNEGVSDKASQFVKRALKEAEEKKTTIDAVVYTSGKKVVAVKFKDQATPENKGLGRVNKVNGLEVYVMADPVTDYEVVNDKGPSLKAKSLLTAGLVNNSIEEDIEQFAKKLVKDNSRIDALVYTSGKTAVGVKFKGNN